MPDFAQRRYCTAMSLGDHFALVRLQLHLVHTNMYYGADVNRIEGNHDGLAVLGVFIQVRQLANLSQEARLLASLLNADGSKTRLTPTHCNETNNYVVYILKRYIGFVMRCRKSFPVFVTPFGNDILW